MAVMQESLEFVLRALGRARSRQDDPKSPSVFSGKSNAATVWARGDATVEPRCQDGAQIWAWGSILLLIFVPHKVHCTL